PRAVTWPRAGRFAGPQIGPISGPDLGSRGRHGGGLIAGLRSARPRCGRLPPGARSRTAPGAPKRYWDTNFGSRFSLFRRPRRHCATAPAPGGPYIRWARPLTKCDGCSPTPVGAAAPGDGLSAARLHGRLLDDLDAFMVLGRISWGSDSC